MEQGIYKQINIRIEFELGAKFVGELNNKVRNKQVKVYVDLLIAHGFVSVLDLLAARRLSSVSLQRNQTFGMTCGWKEAYLNMQGMKEGNEIGVRSGMCT